MSGAQVLLEALEDLCEDDFHTFKWYLTNKVLDGCRPIARRPPGERQTHRHDDPGPLQLRPRRGKMHKNNCALELQQAYAAEKASQLNPSVGPSPGAGPGPGPGVCVGPGPFAPAGSHMAAQGSSVIVAPSVSGGTIGTMNITISPNK
ncbi:hypothetical protein WMY93_005789 [Mugilogobius chulae]|uniref:Pyrin domain-containing protein n=1 Tax=Mugilogobius chulae TaxID=88201 RepID=A0AAW0PTL2_9GOBI